MSCASSPPAAAAAALARRRAARLAISELFLDSQLDDAAFRRLRDALRATGLRAAELDSIYYDQVAPVLHRNLSSPAGAWDGFDPDWLEAQIDRHLARPNFPFFTGLRRRYVTHSTIADWHRLRQMVVSDA